MTPLVDGVIIIASTKSNFGDVSPVSLYTHIWEPDPNKPPVENERTKRNFGLQKARQEGYTHFLMMDADEFYDPTEFKKEWARFEDPNLLGLVCRVRCYFGLPTLTIGYDVTLVPFIHKITPKLCFTWNKNYPFAWSTVDGVPWTQGKQIRIDPTRQMNIDYNPSTVPDEWGKLDKSGVKWSDITMFHYSWIRSDVKKKIRNSTARSNIERSTILTDYCQAKDGYFCEFYGKTLVSCPNDFGVPELRDVHTCLQLGQKHSPSASPPDADKHQ